MADDFAWLGSQVHIDAGQNNNKFYRSQVLETPRGFYAWTRWGRVGEVGVGKLEGPTTKEAAVKSFCAKFKAKTKYAWEGREAEYPGGKAAKCYTVIHEAQSAGEQAAELEAAAAEAEAEAEAAEVAEAEAAAVEEAETEALQGMRAQAPRPSTSPFAPRPSTSPAISGSDASEIFFSPSESVPESPPLEAPATGEAAAGAARPAIEEAVAAEAQVQVQAGEAAADEYDEYDVL